jgi:CDP-glucose 4,6-dehydratase
MEWKNKRVFITGATGFIGSHLLDFLIKQGADVFSLSHTHSGLLFDGIKGDLKDFPGLCEIVGRFQPDVVFHLGAQAIHDIGKNMPQMTIETNVMGTTNLLEACRLYAHPRAIVVASSDKAYGESKRMPYVEDMPLQGNAPYEVSKSCTDLIAQAYRHTYLLPVSIARCGNVFGGGDMNFSRIIPYTIRQVLQHKPVELRSDGTLKRDYIYVEDVVNAYVTLAESICNKSVFAGGASPAYNFGYEEPISVLEIVDKVFHVMNYMERVVPKNANICTGNVEIQDQWLHCEKAKRELGWEPGYDLDTGLQDTVEWYRRYFND